MDSEWLSEMLDIEPITTRLPATDSRIVELEKHIGVELPSEYRDFLSRFGGSWVKGIAPISEPTPFGDATIESFYGFIDGKPRSCDLKFQSDLAQGAPVAIPIAGGAFGCQTFIIGDDNPTLG
ncbi:MAG: SMI1/KNR4 family protein [Planctomycetota bacterium]